MKLLFIDSNIFLDFYDFSKEDLDQLSKLVDLVKKEEIKLFLTTQVCNEIKKNREERLRKAYEIFDQANPNIPMPAFSKNYQEYDDLKNAQNLVQRIKSKLSKNLWKDVEKKRLKADVVINNLIKQSTIIESDKYLDLAEKRYRLGKPPGKKDKSHGDEVNWEALLAEVSDVEDFIIISGDSDYSSLLDNLKLKDFLVNEWKKIKKNEIYFYKTLTSFFSEHEINIQLRIEQEKDELVKDLVISRSFLSTHNTISELGKYTTFSEEQVKGLATALLENSQVGGIIDDSDVSSFYKRTFSGKSDMFLSDIWRKIKKIVFGEDESITAELKDLDKKYSEDETEKEGDL